jgi:hypothetical protein
MKLEPKIVVSEFPNDANWNANGLDFATQEAGRGGTNVKTISKALRKWKRDFNEEPVGRGVWAGFNPTARAFSRTLPVICVIYCYVLSLIERSLVGNREFFVRIILCESRHATGLTIGRQVIGGRKRQARMGLC